MVNNNKNLSDFSMLELFSMEVEAQATVLTDNLLELENNPHSAQSLEDLMRASHSIKGAARIVDIDPAVEIAHLMEDCFVAAQHSEITIESEQIDILLQAVDFLQKISQLDEQFLDNWLTENHANIEQIKRNLNAINTKQIEIITPNNEPLKSQAQTLESPLSDNSLIDIFKTELINQITIIKNNLFLLQTTALSSEIIGEILAAIQSLKSSAIIVEIKEIINLLASVENCIITASEGKINLQIPEIELILQTILFLEKINQVNNLELNNWLSENSQEIGNYQTVLETVISEANIANLETLVTNATIETVINESDNYLDNLSLKELFSVEVETQATILKEQLLSLLNKSGEDPYFEGIMSAIYSLNGAANLVEISPCIKLAQSMETCLLAASEGNLILTQKDIELLNNAVDIFIHIGSISEDNLENWLLSRQDEIDNLIISIQAIINQKDNQQTQILPSHNLTEITQESNREKSLSHSKERVVRVSAENLNRLMGLAGESLLESNWLQPFASSLLKLKKKQNELEKTLEKMQEFLLKKDYLSINEYLKLARLKEQESRIFLGDRLNELDTYTRRTTNLSDRLYREVILSQMRPFGDGIESFPRMVRDLAKKLNKKVKFEIIGKNTAVDRDILNKLEAPITHILRNCLDHGIETPEERLAVNKKPEGTIKIEAAHRGGMLSIIISDDGRGVNLEKLRQKIIDKKLVTPAMANQLKEQELMEFLFLPGFSTASQITEISGRGVGLDIAKSMTQEVGGTVKITSQFGQGISFHFQLPLTLSVIRTLLVEISGEIYAFSLSRIERIVRVKPEEINLVENRQYFTFNNENISLIAGYQVLELKPSIPHSADLPVVIIGEPSNRFGIVVDKFIAEKDLVVRPLDSRLGKVKDISAAALTEDGSPILIFDVSDLVRSIDKLLNSTNLTQISGEIAQLTSQKSKRILVVDDSITVREMERKLLENNGYKVEVAVNGMEGWNAVRTNDYDLVITDIDMPRMNGIELVTEIKNHPHLKTIPVIIVSYKDREQDRIKGLEAGANYYLTKSSFHDDTLVNAVLDLIGE